MITNNSEEKNIDDCLEREYRLLIASTTLLPEQKDTIVEQFLETISEATKEEKQETLVDIRTQLSLIKQETEHARAFEDFMKTYKPKHQHVYSFHQSHFDAQFAEALENTSSLADFLRIESSEDKDDLNRGIYSCPFFTKQFCIDFVDELHHLERCCEKQNVLIPRPNSMNNEGFILLQLGFHDLLDGIMSHCVQPISSALFPEFGGDCIDDHHSFIVKYQLSKDHKLNLHFDDAEVTFNVSLTDAFEGGDLIFEGLRTDHTDDSTPPSDVDVSHKFRLKHDYGRVVIHAGQHRHSAEPITDGERLNLIIWGRSTKHRSSSCTCEIET